MLLRALCSANRAEASFCPERLITGSNGFRRAASAGSVLVAAGGAALTGLALEVLRQTVRPLVVRRRNHCW